MAKQTDNTSFYKKYKRPWAVVDRFLFSAEMHTTDFSLTCLMPYLISKSKKLYSLACAGRGMAVVVSDAPVDGGPLTVRPPTDAWYASILAKLAITGSAAKASVSLQSSTECTTLSMSFGCLSISR